MLKTLTIENLKLEILDNPPILSNIFKTNYTVPVPGVLAFKTLSKKVIKFIRFFFWNKIENTEG